MGAAALFQLATVWTDNELFDIGYEQASDVMVLTHLEHIVVKLSRYGHADWTMLKALFGSAEPAPAGQAATASFTVTTGAHAKDHTYAVTARDDETGEESLPATTAAVSNDLTLHGNYNEVTVTPAAGKTYPVYKSDGGPFGYIGTADADTGYLRDENILPDYSDSFPRERVVLDSVGEYPGVVTFFDQRQLFGRTLNSPNAIYGSQSSNLFNFNTSRPIQPDDAVTFGVLARRVNAILHLVPLKELIVFTTDTVFSIGKGLTPTEIDITPQGYRGASKVRPVAIGDVIMFNTARGRTIRTLNYTFERDGYRGNDITVFAHHLFTKYTVVDMAWTETPTSTMWVVRSDGKLLALTWLEEQEVWGWSLCETSGFVESCCAVGEAGEDILYVVVRREINGSTVRYIERTASLDWTDLQDAVYVDCATFYDGPPATTISGLDYLEGSTVSVLADGNAIRNKVVVGGQITLPAAATRVTVGLPYEAWIKTLPLAPALQGGSIKGRPQIMGYQPSISVRRSRGMEVALSKKLDLALDDDVQVSVASDEAVEFSILKTRDSEALNSLPDLYTGVLIPDLGPGNWTEDQTGLVVRQTWPLPMTILGVQLDVQAGG